MKTKYSFGEVKLVTLRETPAAIGDTPERISEYYENVIKLSTSFTDETENFYVIFLNTRRRITGYQLVTMGTLDTLLVHPREVFRAAIIAGASAIVIMHNHPSGDPTPSEADVKVTRDLIRAGQLIKIEVLDHIIMGTKDENRIKNYSSLRELGYFNN